jgi:putative pyruvate formate lyase activating enzyme
MLSGCPLTCPSCHNPEMVAKGSVLEISAFIDLSWELAKQGAHNLQILSPTVHLPKLRTALKDLKGNGFPIPVVLKSSGFEKLEELQKLESLVDIYLPDFKFGTKSRWAAKARVRSYFEIAKIAVAEMFRQTGPVVFNADGLLQKGVLVRHVLSPLPESERQEILAYLEGLPEGIAVSLSDTFVDFENGEALNGEMLTQSAPITDRT